MVEITEINPFFHVIEHRETIRYLSHHILASAQAVKSVSPHLDRPPELVFIKTVHPAVNDVQLAPDQQCMSLRGWHGDALHPVKIEIVVGILLVFFPQESDILKIIEEEIKETVVSNLDFSPATGVYHIVARRYMVVLVVEKRKVEAARIGIGRFVFDRSGLEVGIFQFGVILAVNQPPLEIVTVMEGYSGRRNRFRSGRIYAC